MPKKCLPQEGLKLIACVCMLVDHIGYLFVPGYHLRAVGRLAFPIFCFLVAEGEHHTRSAGRYALRLGLWALITELPFDFFACRGWNWRGQNVMFTLLLGFLAVQAIRKFPADWLKIAAVAAAALLAEVLRTVVSQQLLPDVHGGLVPACEIMHMNSAIRSLIRDNKSHQIDNVIASGGKEGMCTMDQSIVALFREGLISRETALEYATHPEQIARQLG